MSFILILCSLVLAVSCDNPDLDVYRPNENFRRAGDFIKNNYDLSLFNAAVEKAGLWDELNGEGPFTVFAPTNEAFNAIGIYRPSDFERMNTDSLRFVLACHVLTTSLRTEDIPTKSINNLYPTLAETQAEIASEEITDWGYVSTYASIYGARVLQMNITLSNGILHTLRNVINYHPDKDIQQQLESMSGFSVLIAGLKKTGRWAQLAEEGPFTVFAASDELFAEVGINLENVDELPAEEGDWLFGTYILAKRKLYLNDIAVFVPVDGVPGGDVPREYLPNYGDLHFGIKRTGLQTIPAVLSVSSTSYRPFFEREASPLPGHTDYRVSNGIIHELTALPLVPDDASMMNALRQN